MPSETILVIDAGTSNSVATALTDRGYRVVTAVDNEAVATATAERPRLVVLNAAGSNAAGHRVCRQLKMADATRNVRVLMLTGKTEGDEPFWGSKQGADAYLSGTIARDELVYNVTRLI